MILRLKRESRSEGHCPSLSQTFRMKEASFLFLILASSLCSVSSADTGLGTEQHPPASPIDSGFPAAGDKPRSIHHLCGPYSAAVAPSRALWVPSTITSPGELSLRGTNLPSSASTPCCQSPFSYTWFSNINVTTPHSPQIHLLLPLSR